MEKKILDLVNVYEADARRVRHYLHENPEVATEEVETSRFLKERVGNLGLTIEEVPKRGRSAGHGFIATLDTGRPGKTIALRTDIDALPVKESLYNLAQPRKVMSQNDGVMHACGHDGHMAILLASMKILSDLRNELSGKIIFVFEEGEEISAGICEMVNLLKSKEIDAFYGNHLASFLNTGQIAIDPGPIMAAISRIDFKVIGRGGHGSRPDLSINPLYAGVDILNSISVAWNNQINVEKTVTLGLTEFHVGEAYNVFADEARIGGSLRYFDVTEGQRATNLFYKIAENVAKAHNCHIKITEDAGELSIPVENDETLAEIARASAQSLFPHALVDDITWFASESFSRYGEIAPYVFSFIGTRNTELGSGAEHHNEFFDMDDESLKYGIGTMVKFTVDFLTQSDKG